MGGGGRRGHGGAGSAAAHATERAATGACARAPLHSPGVFVSCSTKRFHPSLGHAPRPCHVKVAVELPPAHMQIGPSVPTPHSTTRVGQHMLQAAYDRQEAGAVAGQRRKEAGRSCSEQSGGGGGSWWRAAPGRLRLKAGSQGLANRLPALRARPERDAAVVVAASRKTLPTRRWTMHTHSAKQRQARKLAPPQKPAQPPLEGPPSLLLLGKATLRASWYQCSEWCQRSDR